MMSAIATNAATVRAVAAQLAAWGWPCELYPGWATRKNRQQTLVWESVTVHHTGAGPVATSYMTNPTDRPKLVVLCNAHITKDHRIRIIAAGGSSHAGMSDRANYATMRAGKAPLSGSMKPGPDSATFSANRVSFGIEVDNNRKTPEWDEWMLGATVALCAALHKVSGWPVTSAPRVITHKELTRRKPGDPILDAGKLRSLVKAFLAAPYGPPGSKPYATPQPTDRQFRLVWANGQAERWGGVADNSPRRGQELRTLKPSIIAGCEFSETARNATRKILGGSWVTWPEGYVWITWDKQSWECTGHTTIDYGTPYHGAISCTLQSLKPVGRGMNIIAMHVRPADSYPGKSDSYIVTQKRATINTTLKELVVKGVTTIVCGDFNITNVDDIFKTYGLVRMTPNVPTTDDGKPIDMVWATPDVITRKATLHNPGPLSDHKWWLVQGTLPATT